VEIVILRSKKAQPFGYSKVSYSPLDNVCIITGQPGNRRPPEEEIHRINYTGSFLNGKVFESTYQRGQP